MLDYRQQKPSDLKKSRERGSTEETSIEAHQALDGDDGCPSGRQGTPKRLGDRSRLTFPTCNDRDNQQKLRYWTSSFCRMQELTLISGAGGDPP